MIYQEWSAVWLEQPIVVKRWYRNDSAFRLREELWVGNILVDCNQIGLTWFPPEVWICERLAAAVSIVDRSHHLEVSISSLGCKIVCNIILDGKIIGGDVDVKIPRTDLTECLEIRRRGFRHFLIENASYYILRFAFAAPIFALLFVLHPFMSGVPITWEFTLLPLLQFTAITMPLCLFGGIAIACNHWRLWGKMYALTLAHQRKLDAPPVRLEIDSYSLSA